MKALQWTIFGLAIMLGYSVAAQDLTGSGNVVKETRDVSGFTGVDVGGAFDVEIREGNSFKVEIEADDNLIGTISTEVSDGVLKIKNTKNVKNSKALNVYITLPELKTLSAHGGVDVKGKNTFHAPEIKLTCSGASDVKLDVETGKSDIIISGSSDLILTGSGSNMMLSCSGSSDFSGKDFEVKKARITASGASDIHVHTTESVSVVASGSCDIHCAGNPSSKQVTTSGASEVHYQ